MSAVLHSTLPSATHAWRRNATVLVLLLLGVLLLYRDTAVAMERVWANSETFAHAYLVPIISAWLTWRLRAQLAQLTPRAEPWALLPLALLTLPWLLGQMVAVNALTQFALMAMLVTCVLLVCGRQVFVLLLFPLGFLFFCVPVGDFLLPTLMEGTADFTIGALRASGIPVYREGLQFVIPSGNWSVVEACSGVRYLIASLMVGTLFAYLNYRSMLRRTLFIGVSILVPVVANWVRAYLIVMLGHLSNNKIATGVDHLVYGWVFFGIVITVMFMLGSRWAQPETPVTVTATAADAVARPAWVVVVTALLALTTLALPQALLARVERQLSEREPVLSWPAAAASEWKLSAAQPDWSPRFQGERAHWRGVFERGGAKVSVHVYYYRKQSQGGKLASSQNILVLPEDSVWNPMPLAVATTSLDGAEVRWRATHMLRRAALTANTRQHLVVWQSYWVDDQFTPSAIGAKLHGARGLLAGRGDDGAAILLHTDRGPDDGGGQLLSDFAQAQLPALRDALRRTRDER